MLRNIVIAVVVVSIIVMGSSIFLGETVDNYGTSINHTQFNSTFNRIDDISDDADDMEAKIDDEGGFVDNAYGTVSGSWAVIKMMFKSLAVGKDLIYEGVAAMKLPIWFALGLALIAVITVVALVAGVLFRRAI